jgi:hypothetical protein
VPCGRKTDDPTTNICECCPCTICHFFVLAKRTIDFIFKSLILPLTLLMLVIAGVKFVGAAGSPEKISEAKRIALAAILGFIIASSTWLIINSALSFVVQRRPPALPEVAKILGQSWNYVNCTPGKICTTATCGDGIVQKPNFYRVDEECEKKEKWEGFKARANAGAAEDIDGLNGINEEDYFLSILCSEECRLTCGNGKLDPGEDCDGTILKGKTCVDFGFQGGILQCDRRGKFDTRLCASCGDGIVQTPPEECEIGDSQICTGTFTTDLPSYCSGIPLQGIQHCKSDCSWDDCVLSEPSLTTDNYGDCNPATIYLTDYACCELTGCCNDACCKGANSCDASVPSGYTLQGTLINRDVNKGTCKLGQSGTNWAVSVCHTTAGYQCWK